jgi:hypothetical protein
VADVNIQTGTIYVRWQKDASRLVNSFRVEQETPARCLRCDNRFDVDSIMHLYALGPENATEARDHDAGRWYTAVAAAYHSWCLDLALAADHG